MNKLIDVDYNKRTITLYEKNQKQKTFHEVYIGKNGLTNSKIEGDMATPYGLFNLGFAFGTEDIDIAYHYYQLNENCYWVSDSNSNYYNEWVEVSKEQKKYPYSYMHTVSKIEWQEAEHLIDYPVQYELAIVIEYNVNPRQIGKGSAIFLHVKKKDYTAGCISTTKENMLYILNWLGDEQAKIYIH